MGTNPNETLPVESLLVLLAYTGIVWMMWAYHFLRAYGKWRRERDARSSRNFIIAVMLFVATATIFAAVLGRIWPGLIDLVRFFGYIVRGMLVVGGIYVIWSWRKDDHDNH